ncbi:MAG: AAA family ATPase, partial [Mailhella sp.]
MAKILPLAAEKLHSSLDANKIPWETSDDIPKSLRKDFSQPRAVNALNLAVNIKDNGYNIYLAGENDLGRGYMLYNFLKPIAQKKETPPDLLYVNNFEDTDSPILLKVTAGQGKILKSELAKILQQIKKEIPLRFETEAYEKKRQTIISKFQSI